MQDLYLVLSIGLLCLPELAFGPEGAGVIMRVRAARHDVLGRLAGTHPLVRLPSHRATASQVRVDERFADESLHHQRRLILVLIVARSVRQ